MAQESVFSEHFFTLSQVATSPVGKTKGRIACPDGAASVGGQKSRYQP
jgi:hypothetical protein